MSTHQLKQHAQEGLLLQMRQTNFWNILSKDLDGVDLTKTNIEVNDFPVGLIQQLIEQEDIYHVIRPKGAATPIIEHLSFSCKNEQQLKGYQSFACGFPLFIYKDPKNPFRPIAAPLFIWRFNLEPDTILKDTWHLSRKASTPPEPNYSLLYHLEKTNDFQVIDKYKTIAHNNTLTKKYLSQLCYDLIIQLNLEDHRSTTKIFELPNIENAIQLSKKGAIHWSGTLALFPLQLFDDAEQLLMMSSDTKTPSLAKYRHHFGLLLADPFQKQVIEKTATTAVGVVNGAPGSGKTHTIANSISNGLSNGQKCLVISDRMNALAEVKQHLNGCGLGDLSIQINTADDIETLLAALPSKATTGSDLVYQEENFNLYLSKCQREQKRLDEGFAAIKGQKFGHYSWTATVGQFLQANRMEGKELLNSQLNPNEFIFSFDEYEILKNHVIKSEPLYRKINTLRHPLKNLNVQIFQKNTLTESKDFIEDQLALFLQKTSRLQHRYIHKTDEYGHKLRTHYEEHFQDLSKQLQAIEENISDGSSRYGKKFEGSGILQSGKNKVYKVFSKKHQSIFDIHQKIQDQYLTLRQTCEKRNYFDYTFSEFSDTKNIHKLRKSLNDFSTHLKTWQSQISNNLQEEVTRLSHKTIHPELDYKASIVEVENALDILVKELNDSKLYEEVLENKMLTVPMRQQYLESIIEQLETTAYNMRDFEAFYDWQKYWLSLPSNAQKLIPAILKVKPKNWIAAFESWYFHHRLTQKHQVSIPQNDEFLNRFVEAYQGLKKEMPGQILSYWKDQQTNSLRLLKRNKRESHQYLFANRKNNNRSLPKKEFRFLWHVAAPAISDCFPVWLMSPAMAIKLLSKKPQFFDLVFIDQAQSLTAHVGPSLFRLGKRKIAFTDRNEKHFGDQASLVDYFIQEGAKEWTLPYQHRKVAEPIALFNQQQLFPPDLPFTHSRTSSNNESFKVIETDGTYNEQEQTNEKEAKVILEQLRLVKRNSQNTYPSICIACSTEGQRNYIARKLLAIKRQKATGYEKIIALEEAGLGVYQLEALNGLHPDILLCSITLASNKSGTRLTKDLDYFKNIDGQRGHYLFATRPLQQLIIVHSFPLDILNYFFERPEEGGLFHLFKHLLFAQAVENNDIQQQQQLLSQFEEENTRPTITSDHSVFMEELANALRPYLTEGRIQLNATIHNLSLPLTIQPKHEQQAPLVIQADGFFSDANLPAYLWEQHLRDEIQQLGLAYYPIWSVNWWKNPKLEARKLASAIIKMDGEFET